MRVGCGRRFATEREAFFLSRPSDVHGLPGQLALIAVWFAATGLPAASIVAPQGAFAANECTGGAPGGGSNVTRNCAGNFPNGIEYEPAAVNETFTLNVGSPTAATVNAPAVNVFGLFNATCGRSRRRFLHSGANFVLGGVNATSVINVLEGSSVTGSSHGVYMYTDGTDNDATVNNYGTVAATGEGDSFTVPSNIVTNALGIAGLVIGSPGIGINVVAGNPLGGPAGSGDATANNYGTVTALGNGINVWSQNGTATALNGIGKSVTSTGGNGVYSSADPLTGLVPTLGHVAVYNGGSVGAADIGIFAPSLDSVKVDGVTVGDDPTVYGSVNATNGPGILALAPGDVEIDAGAVTSGAEDLQCAGI